MKSVTIIVPVKDEEEGLKYLLSDFRSSNLSSDFEINFIFVIDERTSDKSRYIAQEFSHQIIDQKGTHGKGAAMQQAIDYWKNAQSSVVVFLDADGSYSFDGVRKILNSIEGGSDVASGSRFLDGVNPKGMSRLHHFGNKSLSFISSLRNRRRISDLCTGLWGFTSYSLNELSIKSNGFDIEAEIVGQIRRKGLNHAEVPIEWSQRKGGSSKLRSLRDGLIIFFRILRT